MLINQAKCTKMMKLRMFILILPLSKLYKRQCLYLSNLTYKSICMHISMYKKVSFRISMLSVPFSILLIVSLKLVFSKHVIWNDLISLA